MEENIIIVNEKDQEIWYKKIWAIFKDDIYRVSDFGKY